MNCVSETLSLFPSCSLLAGIYKNRWLREQVTEVPNLTPSIPSGSSLLVAGPWLGPGVLRGLSGSNKSETKNLDDPFSQRITEGHTGIWSFTVLSLGHSKTNLTVLVSPGAILIGQLSFSICALIPWL